jgi:hypothetical protein
MKSSATACFETPWAVGIITLVRKIFFAHDGRPGMVKEAGLGWNDVLTMEILVASNCVGDGGTIWAIWQIRNDLAIRFACRIDLPYQFGNSIWQLDLAIRSGKSIWRFKFI